MLSPTDQFLQGIFGGRDGIVCADYRDCVTTDRELGAGQLFNDSPGFSFSTDDSTVYPANLSLVLTKEFVEVNDSECEVID